MRYLVSRGTTVVIYYSDADYNVPWVGDDYYRERSSNSGLLPCANVRTSNDVTYGQFKRAVRFSFVRIYKAGRKAPFYQLLAVFEVFDRAINAIEASSFYQMLTKLTAALLALCSPSASPTP